MVEDTPNMERHRKNDADMLPEAMDKLLTLPGTNVSLVYGIDAITTK